MKNLFTGRALRLATLSLILLIGCSFIDSSEKSNPSGNDEVDAKKDGRPRLILNVARLEELKGSMKTTRAAFWKDALASALAFSREPIPAMKDAHNNYRRFGDTMPALGLAYHLTGDRTYVDAANRWLLALDAVPQWKGSQNLGRSSWVVGSAILYDWLHDELPEGTLQKVRERLVSEGDILLKETSYWRLLSNHCLIETAALGMIGLTLEGEHPRAHEFLEKARERTELIIEHAPLDGSWGEGVQYWQYGLGYFLRWLEASRTASNIDYFPRYEWLKKTGFFPLYFSLPSNPSQSVNFSDCGDGNYVNGFLLYLPASRYHNGYFQDFANKARKSEPYTFSWMDFITYDPAVAPADYTSLPPFKHFEDNGFVIMRSDWSRDATLVGFRCGPAPGHRNQDDPRREERHGFGPGHGHPDINSFSLFSNGQWLALDPGYVYEKWTHDHNTLVVNGKGQAGEGEKWLDYMAFESRQPAPAILRADTKAEYDYIIGDAGNIYVDEARLTHFRRHLLFLKPSTVVILDDLEAKATSQYEWLLQAYDKASQMATDQFVIERDGVRLWVHPVRPSGYQASIKSHPLDGSATNGTLTTLDLTASSSEPLQFLVVLSVLPDRQATPPQVTFSNGLLKIASREKTWDIKVSEAAGVSDRAAPLMKVLEK